MGRAVSDKKLTDDERESIAHALDHLNANRIHVADAYPRWYSGNKDRFIERHVKAISILERMLKEASRG